MTLSRHRTHPAVIAAAALACLLAGTSPCAGQSFLRRLPVLGSSRLASDLPDGGVVLGRTEGAGVDAKPQITRMAPDASVAWSLTLDEPGTSLVGLQAALDGSIALVAQEPGPIDVSPVITNHIIRLSPDGAISWQALIPGSEAWINEAIATPDGGAMAVGATPFLGSIGGDALLVKLDSSGAIEWVHAFDFDPLNQCFAAIRELPAGGYLIVGRSQAALGTSTGPAWLLALDAAGDVRWESVLHGQSDCWGDIWMSDDGSWIKGLADGRILIGGGGYQRAGICRRWMASLDSDGTLQYSLRVADATFGKGAITDATLAPNGDLILAGWVETSSVSANSFLTRTSPAWDFAWTVGTADATLPPSHLVARPDGTMTGISFEGLLPPQVPVLRTFDLNGSGCGLAPTSLAPIWDLAPTASADPVASTLSLRSLAGATSVAAAMLVDVRPTTACGQPLAVEGNAPGEVPALLVQKSGSVMPASWTQTPGAQWYSLYEGGLLNLRAGTSDLAPAQSWSSGDPACRIAGNSATLLPLAGARMFLVAAANVAGEGPLGFDSRGIGTTPAAACP